MAPIHIFVIAIFSGGICVRMISTGISYHISYLKVKMCVKCDLKLSQQGVLPELHGNLETYSPCTNLGSWYCQMKQAVMMMDSSKKNTRPSWVHFTFILLVLVNPSKASAGAGFMKTTTNNWKNLYYFNLKLMFLFRYIL